jgi:hypothetical protein
MKAKDQQIFLQGQDPGLEDRENGPPEGAVVTDDGDPSDLCASSLMLFELHSK